MSINFEFNKEKLIIGIMFKNGNEIENTFKKLEKKFGTIDYKSKIYDFNWTTYYEKEMGKNIYKILISFKKLVDPEKLSDIKIWTNKLESKFLDGGKRKINLDPGILDYNRLILATTKNRGHRIPLQKGIYGEITTIYQNRDFIDLPWTYDDYKSDEFKIDLKKIRLFLKEDKFYKNCINKI